MSLLRYDGMPITQNVARYIIVPLWGGLFLVLVQRRWQRGSAVTYRFVLSLQQVTSANATTTTTPGISRAGVRADSQVDEFSPRSPGERRRT